MNDLDPAIHVKSLEPTMFDPAGIYITHTSSSFPRSLARNLAEVQITQGTGVHRICLNPGDDLPIIMDGKTQSRGVTMYCSSLPSGIQ